MARRSEHLAVGTTVEGAPGDIATALLQILFFREEVFPNTDPSLLAPVVDFDVNTVSGRFGTALSENEKRSWLLKMLFKKSPEKVALEALAQKIADPALGIDRSRIKFTSGGLLIDGHPIEVAINDQAENVPANGNLVVLDATSVKKRKERDGAVQVAANSNEGKGAKIIAITSPAKGMHSAMRNITRSNADAMAEENPYPVELLSCSTQAAAQILNAFIQKANEIGSIESAAVALPHAPTPSDNPETIAHNGYPNSSGLEKSLGRLFPDLFVMGSPWRFGDIPSSGITVDLTFPEPLASTKEEAKLRILDILHEYETQYPGTYHFVEGKDKQTANLQNAARVPHAATIFTDYIEVHSSLRRFTISGGYDNVYGYTAQILHTLSQEINDFADTYPHALFTLLHQLKSYR